MVQRLDHLPLVRELRAAQAVDQASRAIAGRDLPDHVLELRQRPHGHGCLLAAPRTRGKPRAQPHGPPNPGSRSARVSRRLLPVMPRALLLLGVAVVMLTAHSGIAVEQTVEEIVPPGEQRVETLGGANQQAVHGVDVTAEQEVAPQEPPSAAAKAAQNVGKVATGITAAAVSLGATAAMLLFL